MTAGNADQITIQARPSPCIALAYETGEVRRVLASAAKAHGFDVLEAVDDVELVEQLGRWTDNGGRRPDVLVMASELPGTAWAIPTMLIARSEDERARLDASGANVRAVMVWPCDPDDFVTVARFLARRANIQHGD